MDVTRVVLVALVVTVALSACGGSRVTTEAEAIDVVKQTLRDERYLIDRAECLGIVNRGDWTAKDDSDKSWLVGVTYLFSTTRTLTSQSWRVHKKKELVLSIYGLSGCNAMHADFRPPDTTTYAVEAARGW